MNYKHFIGIDVSKQTLDLCVMQQNQKVFSLTISNSEKELKLFWKQLLKQCPHFDGEQAIFCMEHTGIYNNFILDFLLSKHVAICLENPTQIKYSNGMQRGKNDKIDAERIALYAYKERENLKTWQPPRTVIKLLKHLSVLRTRLLNSKKALSAPLKELSSFDKQAAKAIEPLTRSTLRQIDNDLQKIELRIQEIINSDDTLKRLFKITTSISGVGKVTAWEVIICTNEFKTINNAQKFACYAGVAPFEHSSGTSVRGKTRVSHKANKHIKSLLHMGAIAAISANTDLKTFYQRKVEEGKNKMSVINAVRNKLIHRIFACVRGNRLYQNNFNISLA